MVWLREKERDMVVIFCLVEILVSGLNLICDVFVKDLIKLCSTETP